MIIENDTTNIFTNVISIFITFHQRTLHNITQNFLKWEKNERWMGGKIIEKGSKKKKKISDHNRNMKN